MDPLEKLERGENMGVIIDVRPTDWIAGGETGIVFEERNPSGDWEKFKPSDEMQRRKTGSGLGYDTNSCTNFSCMNCIEMGLTQLYESGQIPAESVNWLRQNRYFDENGKVNLSDWFNAITSGTTNNGNNLQAPWDAARKFGVIPQWMGPVPNDFESHEGWFGMGLTPAQLSMGKAFLERFQIQYEWVVVSSQGEWKLFAKHLKHAPLHVATPTCKSWNTAPPSIVRDCGDYKRLNHAHTNIGQREGKYHKNLDHYVPFVKHLDWDYWMPHAIKGVVTPKQPPKPPVFQYNFQKNLRFGFSDSKEVRMLQTALQTVVSKTGKPYMTPGVFGPYGPQTRAAVGWFQTEHGIRDPDGQGTNFGPQTRAALNAELLKIT